MSSQSESKFDELQWVIQIRRTLEEDIEDYDEVPRCIFNVPKALLASDPDSYTPQHVALGPYHYWRPELYEMERYKVAAAKRAQKQLQSLNFQNVVDQLRNLEQRIRACYHRHLDFNGETLAWMMAIDASFLLEFLQIFVIREGMGLTRVSSRMSPSLDYARTKSAHNSILRDIVMLENQIPLFVLRKMSEFQFSSLETADNNLRLMLMGLFKELSPFDLTEDLPKIQVSERTHLLDFLYHMMVPKMEKPTEIIEVEDHNEDKQGEEKPSADSRYVEQVLNESSKLLSKLRRGLKQALKSRPVKLIQKLPWTIVSNLPIFTILKQPVVYLFFSPDKEEHKPRDENTSSNNNISRPPLVEEITIPSVTELSKSGVHFVPTKGTISTISFDIKTATFYLPTIALDVNTEVILRNLVAYEASNASGPLAFTRYTELMNGIIDTEEDVQVLRERGIILNRLRSDGEVANLWNGMSKSIRLTRVPFLDKVIEDVNRYHNSRWRVKVGKYLKLNVFGCWQILVLLAAVLLLFLMTLQAFCSFYTWTRLLAIKNI